MKTKFSVLISILFFLSACGSSPPEVDSSSFQWCYTFDFINSTYDIDFLYGSESPDGLQSDGGILSVNYSHNQIVSPGYISSDIRVVTSASVDVLSNLDIFGVEADLEASIPAGDYTSTINGVPDGSGAFSSSASLVVTTSSIATVYIQSLTVYGNGFNPFPDNDCMATPTPSNTPNQLPTFTPTNTPQDTDTPIPSATFTPTDTPEPTVTLTPSETLEPTWCYRFTNSWGAFSITQGTPTSSGIEFVQWRYNNGTVYSSAIGMEMTIAVPPTSPLTYIRVDAQYDYGSFNGTVHELVVFSTATNRVNLNITDNPYTDEQLTGVISSPSDQDVYIYANGSYTAQTGSYPAYLSASGRITSVELRGDGFNPYGSDNCNVTPTPTPSTTPEPTNTGVATWTPSPTPTSTEDGEAPTSPPGTPETLTPTPTTTYATSTPISTITAIPTRTPGATPTFQPTAPPLPTDDANEFSADGTCENPGGSEPDSEGNGRWHEWLFAGIYNLVECTVMPPINFIKDIANNSLAMLGSIYDLAVNMFQTVGAGIQWTMGQLFPYIGGWLGNFWASMSWYLNNLLAGIWAVLTGLLDFIVNLVSQIINFVRNILDFIMTAFSLVQRLFTFLTSGAVEKPPGLPDCVNDPLNYDICAVYYILEHTMLSGVGAFIIPALVVYLFMLVSLFFLETIVERIQKLWKILGDD